MRSDWGKPLHIDLGPCEMSVKDGVLVLSPIVTVYEFHQHNAWEKAKNALPKPVLRLKR